MLSPGLILLLDSPVALTDIINLQRRGWLPSSCQIENAPYDRFKYWHPTLGLRVKQAAAESLSIEVPCLLFTKWHFEQSGSAHVSGNFTAISSTDWDGKFPSISNKVVFLFHILKWLTTIDQFGCSDPSCLVSNTYKEMPLKFCDKCEEKLAVAGSYLPMAAALNVLGKLQSEQAEQYVNKPIEETLCDLRIRSSSPLGNIQLVERSIDFYSPPGSKKRDWLSGVSQQIYEEKDKIKEEYLEGSNTLPKIPTLIAARRWNSWTPAKPDVVAGKSSREILGRRTGGGYFISDGYTNIAIDPGYGYLELLFDFHRLTIRDLDAVVVTHDHPDHSAGLPNILALRYEYKTLCKPLVVYMNASSFYIYEHLLQYYSRLLTTCGPQKMENQKPYSIGDLSITPISMLHTEIVNYCPSEIKSAVGESSAFGLRIEGSKVPFNFAIVGDTSFPDGAKTCSDLHNFFGKPDIAAVHLGSIERGWGTMAPSVEAHRIEYGKGKHLGLNGCVKMIALLQPRLTVITEFGEELDHHNSRITITETIRQFSQCEKSSVVPSDAGLAIFLQDGELFCRCMGCGRYVPIAQIQVSLGDGGYLRYAYSAGCASGHEHCDI